MTKHLKQKIIMSYYVVLSDCRHNGVVYKAGQSFKPDKCNTCWCMVTGDLSCTDMSCYPGKHEKSLYSGFMTIRGRYTGLRSNDT